MNYQDLKQKQQKELNDFTGIFWAFSNEQFAEGVEAVSIDVDKPKIVSIGAGGYIRADRLQAFKDLLAAHKEELKRFRKDQKELLAAIVYELRNHEYCITYDTAPALSALGLQLGDIDKKILNKACREAVQGVA